jgi:hypothetical protein
MPRSGPSGTYALPPIYLAIPGTTIVVDQHNTPLQDIASTFNTPTPIDYGGTGQTTAAAALAALGGASADMLNFLAVDGSSTANALVLAPTTPIVSLVTGRFVSFTAIADNTGATTINVSGLGVRNLVKATDGGTERALAQGDVVAGGKYIAAYNSTLDTGTGAWVLANPTPFYGSIRNRIVNPAMQISSVNGTSSGTANGYVPADNWAVYRVTSAGVLTSQQVASVTPKGSPNRIRTTITTADASLAAGEYATQTQAIIGNEIADFQYGGSSAQQTILTFGTKYPAGTYSFALHNAANDRSYVGQFTIASANTDEYFTFVIPGDTTGTWTTGSTTGLTLDVVIAAGSTFQGTTGWQAGNILGTASNTNGMGTISNVFELFDVQLTRDPDNLGVAPAWELPSYNYEEIVATSGSITPWVAYTPTFTGFGTATDILFYSRRVGGSLEVFGTFTSGTATGVEGRISFGFNGTSGNVTSSSTKLRNGTTIAGIFDGSVVSTTYHPALLVERSVSYFTFGVSSLTGGVLATALANSIIGAGNVVSINGTVPIEGWD